MIQVTAIIPAGGRLSKTDAELCGQGIKALLQIAGETLLERLLRELSYVERIGQMVVIGPAETRPLAEHAGVLWTGETKTLLGNVQAGVRASDKTGADRILLIGSDLAAPRSESIADFLARAPQGEEVAAPLIPREAFESAYPESPSTFLALREGGFTMGSQFVAPAGLLLAPPPAVAAVLGHRKSQIGMALEFGLPIAAGLLSRTLTLAALERRASQMLTVRASAIAGCAPDLALDIDNAADYRYALASASKEQPVETNSSQ